MDLGPFSVSLQNSIVPKSISNSVFAMSWSCFHVAMFSTTAQLNIVRRGAQEEPPWRLVREQIDIYLERAERAQQIQLKENPDADAQASEAMDDDFEEFMNRRIRSN